MNPEIICFYLPQFYETEYNNKWWGPGYTDWTAVQNAKKFFEKHKQPRVPLNNNYYDLSDESAATLKWQAELAKKYGVYGFCIYHYWFPQKKLLEKPVEILRKHKEIEIHYMLCWDSKTWKRTWYADQFEQEILLQQDFGDENIWKKHFEDLLPDFKDERYIKINNKPVFHIYRSCEISCLKEMKECWNRLAQENGFAGIYLIVGDVENRQLLNNTNAADAFYNYEPVYSSYRIRNTLYGRYIVARAGIIKRINKFLGTEIFPDIRDARIVYKKITDWKENTGKKTYLGVFCDYDDTPRRQIKGVVYNHNNVKYFENCLYRQLVRTKEMGNEFLYINAWNEWGESAYLEPDEANGYMYLETIKKVCDKLK